LKKKEKNWRSQNLFMNNALAHADCSFNASPSLIELTAREEKIKTRSPTSILFL